MWRRLVQYRCTDVSDKPVNSITRVDEWKHETPLKRRYISETVRRHIPKNNLETALQHGCQATERYN
jgi:hypothetical protein